MKSVGCVLIVALILAASVQSVRAGDPPSPFAQLCAPPDLSQATAPAVPTTVSDPIGNLTTWIYDAPGNLITGPPGAQVVQSTYDGVNNVITSTVPAVQTGMYDVHDGLMRSGSSSTTGSTTTYDDAGRTAQTISPLGDTSVYQYDQMGNVLRTTGSSGGYPSQITSSTSSGSFSSTDPLSGTTIGTYDTVGNLITNTHSDGMGHMPTYTYDTLDRQITDVDPLGVTTHMQYDTQDNRIMYNMTNAPGSTTTTTYDTLDRSTSMTDSLGNTGTWTYDSNGNVLSSTNTDPLTRMTITDYDSVGNILSSADVNGLTTTWTYDPMNNLITQTDALGNISMTDKYDATGSMTDPLGDVTTYKYDSVYDLLQTVGPDGLTTRYTFDATDVITANDIATTYTYDFSGTLTPGADSLPAVQQYFYDYNYDFSSSSGLSLDLTGMAAYDVTFTPLPASGMCGLVLMSGLGLCGFVRRCYLIKLPRSAPD
jgi:YD repeat-containing protein